MPALRAASSSDVHFCLGAPITWIPDLSLTNTYCMQANVTPAKMQRHKTITKETQFQPRKLCKKKSIFQPLGAKIIETSVYQTKETASFLSVQLPNLPRMVITISCIINEHKY